MLITTKTNKQVKKLKQKQIQKYKKQKKKVINIINKIYKKSLNQKFIIYLLQFGISKEILIQIINELQKDNELKYKLQTVDNIEYIEIDLSPQFSTKEHSQNL